MNIDYSKQHRQFVIMVIIFPDFVRVCMMGKTIGLKAKQVSHATWEKYRLKLEHSNQRYHIS